MTPDIPSLIEEAGSLRGILDRCADGGYTLARIKHECANAVTMLSRLTTALSLDQPSPSVDDATVEAANLAYTMVLFPECSERSLREEWARMPAKQKAECMDAMRAAIALVGRSSQRPSPNVGRKVIARIIDPVAAEMDGRITASVAINHSYSEQWQIALAKADTLLAHLYKDEINWRPE